MRIEFPYDDHHEFIADVVRIDASFDHDHGTEKQFDYVVENFEVIDYMNGIPYPITSAFNGGQIKFFKEWFLEKFLSEQVAS
jgi:hypothetical protein